MINEALAVTAMAFHGYDESTLHQQGTTATHVVYGCVSKFQAFFEVFTEMALDPASHQRFLSKSESKEDVLRFAASFLTYVCEDLDPE